MAVGLQKTQVTNLEGSDTREVIRQFNNLVDWCRTVAEKLDADVGVDDNDYVATLEAAVKKVADVDNVEQ